MKRNHSFMHRNGLCIVFLAMMLLSLAGQIFTGWNEHNEFLAGYGLPAQALSGYMLSGHFLQATFENWESEFLQMALFVIFTIFLRQQGSSESKACDEANFDPSELVPKKESPWPVKRGGIYLALYKHSLSISLLLLFFASFMLHWYGSWIDACEKKSLEGKPTETFGAMITGSKFWFESFQNWQSEFLSVFAIIFLSIYLRQIGSSQSKKVNEANSKTGEGSF